MNKDLTVCPNCSHPMVWTFMIPYSEWYCLNCGYDYGAIKELIVKQKLYKDIFNQLYKHIFPPRSCKINCKKCNLGEHEYHIEHATELEILKDQTARKLLKYFIGKRK